MCNACGFLCCAYDGFSGCGCDHCPCSACWSDEDEAWGDLEDDSGDYVTDAEWASAVEQWRAAGLFRAPEAAPSLDATGQAQGRLVTQNPEPSQ